MRSCFVFTFHICLRTAFPDWLGQDLCGLCSHVICTLSGRCRVSGEFHLEMKVGHLASPEAEQRPLLSLLSPSGLFPRQKKLGP